MFKSKEGYQPSPEEVGRAESSITEIQRVMSDVRYKILTNPEFRGKKILFIMRGVPGSGKSTIAREIIPSEGVIHSTDKYFYDDEGKYNFDPSKLKEYHDENFKSFCRSLEEEKPIVVIDNTNIQRVHFDRYVDAAKAKGYVVHIVEAPQPDPSVAAERNTHSVPEEVIRRMIEQYEK